MLAAALIPVGLWLALPGTIETINFDPPTQIHLIQGDRDGAGVTFSFVTERNAEGKVHIGTAPGQYTIHVAAAPARRYEYTSRFQGPYISGLIHHVTVHDLDFNTRYLYRCGTMSGDHHSTFGLSPEFGFRTPPAPSPDASVSFAVVGDIGQTNYSLLNIEAIEADDSLTALVILGDLSYADSERDSTPERPCGQERWDSWFQLMQPLFATRLVMPVPGNHDMELHPAPPPATQTPFLAYTERFQPPGPDKLFYSFRLGSVHMIVLNSYSEAGANSPQYRFLAADLAAVDRQVTPWLIVNFHVPWYTSNTHHESDAIPLRTEMEDLLNKYAVDLVFSGHIHNYERTHPVYHGRLCMGAPIYITTGTGGNRQGPALGWKPRPRWSAFRLDAEEAPLRIFGHGRVAVHNRTHLSFTWRSLSQAQDQPMDAVWMVKNEALGYQPNRGVSALP